MPSPPSSTPPTTPPGTPSAAAFLRVGHRGASGECPENTLVSFARALELGVGMIECDLQLTADDHVVVIHDDTLDRTTTGSGTVRSHSLAAIRTLDAGKWKDARYAGERVPTLDETLDLVLPRAQINLELKATGGDAHKLAMAVVAAVGSRSAFDRVIFSSFDPALIEEVRDLSSEARIGVLWELPPLDGAFELAARLGAVAIHPPAWAVTADDCARAHAAGLRVYVWTVNTIDLILEMVGRGVDGVMSDHPGRLLEARARLLTTR